MKILGISAFYHDSAAALIEHGEIITAVQEERFTRKKHDAGFPINAIRHCLESSGTFLKDIDAVVFYDKPLLKFERLLETYYAFAPKGLASFIQAIPVWLREKMFLKKVIREAFRSIDKEGAKELKLLFAEHHLSHAASAFYASPFNEAAILTIDGVGEWATATICKGKASEIELCEELKFPHSVGLLYSAFTYWLGFRVNSGEYKLMGLAPYGNPDSNEVKEFIKIIKENLVDLKDDGSVWLDQDYFKYATGLKMVHEKRWEKLFGMKRRFPESELTQRHCNLALAIQKVTEEIVIKMAKRAKEITGSENLCLAGGVALNCVANGKIFKSEFFENIFVQPAAGDAGGALGAALAGYYVYFENSRDKTNAGDDLMSGALLGPEFSTQEIKKAIKKYKPVFSEMSSEDELTENIVERINNGQVIGWFQGRMEFGPRALGNRSILGNPGDPEMQKKINLKIKFRESFRPFAPVLLEEEVNHLFDFDGTSPYMLFTAPVRPHLHKELPDNYDALLWNEKLSKPRSELSSITHVDFSARLQTVSEKQNPLFRNLLEKQKQETGTGVLINTSFNVRGEPIVCNPEDAYTCFMETEMDCLVMGNLVFDKENQAEWNGRQELFPEQDTEKNADKVLESCLAISTGFIVFWFLFDKEWMLYIAGFVGLAGLFSGWLAGIIHFLWQKLSDILGLFMPKILLGLVYFLLLVPLAMLNRLFGNSAVLLKKRKENETYWSKRSHKYVAGDFDKTW